MTFGIFIGVVYKNELTQLAAEVLHTIHLTVKFSINLQIHISVTAWIFILITVALIIYIPVNIRNVLKWFKHLQNIFKTYLNHILWFSKQVNVYPVMFKNVL